MDNTVSRTMFESFEDLQAAVQAANIAEGDRVTYKYFDGTEWKKVDAYFIGLEQNDRYQGIHLVTDEGGYLEMDYFDVPTNAFEN